MDGLILGLPHYHYIYLVVKGGSDLERLAYPGFNMSLMGSLFQLGLPHRTGNFTMKNRKVTMNIKMSPSKLGRKRSGNAGFAGGVILMKPWN
jgi:hypothetical protein